VTTIDSPTITSAPRHSGLTWNLYGRALNDIRLTSPTGPRVTPEWAWHGSSGQGVRICVVDSGIETENPLVGAVGSAHAVEFVGQEPTIVPDLAGDAFGHGTACASVIRAIAPDCEIHSVRVLGGLGGGTGAALLEGLRWAIGQGFDVINMSLSTTHDRFEQELRALADEAYFRRIILVASAHNTPVESFPWRFASVISVGSHAEEDSDLVLSNPTPPVEFFARGRAVPVAGLGGVRTRNTGNSFATPHIAGRCALIIAKHPGLTPFQLKSILHQTSNNVRGVA